MATIQTTNLPEKHTFVPFFKCLGLVASLGLCVYFLFLSVVAGIRYRMVVPNPLVLQATITHVERDYDSGDEHYEYHAYMSYSHNGREYSDIYKTYTNSSEAERMIGEIITIAVDPENPGRLLSEMRSTCGSSGFMAAILLACTAAIARVPERKYCSETFGWSRSMIQQDIVNLIRSRKKHVWFLVAGLGSVTLWLCFMDVVSNTLLILGVILTIIGLFYLRKYIPDLRLAREGRIIINRDTCVSKGTYRVYKRNRNHLRRTKYVVVYSNGADTWEHEVSAKQYEKTMEGDTIDSAYLEGYKEPVFAFDQENGVKCLWK